MDLTGQGIPSESVLVDVLRDGREFRIAVPRGPIGVERYSD